MSSPSKGEVSYGNLGPVSYDTQNKGWHFPRNNDDDTCFHVLEQELVFPGQSKSQSKDSKPQELLEHANLAEARKHRINALLSTFPELTPGAHTLPALEQTSQAISDLTYVHEPLVSNCLAYGVIGYEENTQVPAYLRARKILASVTGASSHIVRLSLVGEIKRTVDGSFHGVCFVEDDHHHQEHAVFWRGANRAAIRQLCFSNVTPSGSLLAVRRQNGIDILKPTVRKESVYKSKLAESEIGTGEHRNASSLDPNWLLHVSLEYSDDPSIIDLTFHPHIATEFAILNAKGEVVVLQVEERSMASKRWNVSRLAQISIFESSNEGPLGDGWGTILWSKDGDSILGARRNALVACDLSNLTPSTISFSLELLGQQSSILDLGPQGSLTDYYFVLTTSNLAVISQSPCRNEPSTSLQSNYRTLVSIIHHRDSKDTSMRLSIETYDHYVFVLIYSRIVPLITGYKVVLDQKTREFRHITDPFRFALPEMAPPSLGKATTSLSKLGRSISYLTMRAIEFDSSGYDLLSKTCLFHVLVLDKEFELTRMIVTAQSSSSYLENFSLTPLSPETVHRAANLYPRIRNAFVVESDSGSEEDNRFQPSKFHSQSQRERKSLPSYNDFTFLANELNSRLDASNAESQSTNSFEAALGSVLSKWSNIPPGIHTLSDFLSTSLPVNAIDTVSRQAKELLDAIHEISEATEIPSSHEYDSDNLPRKMKLGVLLFGETLQELQDNLQEDKVSLVSIYEKFLQLYLHALPSQISLTVRVWLEKSIRHVAMQLFMTSHGVRATNFHDTVALDDIQDSMTEASESQHFSLPTRTRRQRRTLDPTTPNLDQQADRADTLRSSSQSSNPGPKYAPSSQQSLNDGTGPSEATGATLAGYIEFRAVSPIHRTMRRAIPEWHFGVKPTGLEWRSMSRSASQESIASARGKRQQKKDKGRGRAVSEVESNVSAPELDYLGSTDFVKQEAYQPTEFDLDDTLLSSQISTFPSKQGFPQRDLQHHPIIPRSQLLPVHSSQTTAQDRDNRTKQSRSRKNLLSKKRPSGFR